MFRYAFMFCLLAVITSVNLLAQDNYLHAGQLPPEISYTEINSSKTVTYKSSDLHNKVYLIDFWATWCAPCIESIPHIDSLIEKYKGREIKFISITYEPKSLVEKFLIKHPLKSEIGIDTSFAMFERYNAWAIPNIVMINSKGKIAGRIHPERLNEQVIDDLLKGKVPSVEQTPEDLYKPKEAEKYFRSLLKKKN